MSYRVLPLFVAALALVLLAGAPVLAADKDNTHEGVVVKAGEHKLTMTDKDGKNAHTHDVDKDAKISCDGKDCKLTDLKTGLKILVTTDDTNRAIRIQAFLKTEPPKN